MDSGERGSIVKPSPPGAALLTIPLVGTHSKFEPIFFEEFFSSIIGPPKGQPDPIVISRPSPSRRHSEDIYSRFSMKRGENKSTNFSLSSASP